MLYVCKPAQLMHNTGLLQPNKETLRLRTLWLTCDTPRVVSFVSFPFEARENGVSQATFGGVVAILVLANDGADEEARGRRKASSTVHSCEAIRWITADASSCWWWPPSLANITLGFFGFWLHRVLKNNGHGTNKGCLQNIKEAGLAWQGKVMNLFNHQAHTPKS